MLTKIYAGKLDVVIVVAEQVDNKWQGWIGNSIMDEPTKEFEMIKQYGAELPLEVINVIFPETLPSFIGVGSIT